MTRPCGTNDDDSSSARRKYVLETKDRSALAVLSLVPSLAHPESSHHSRVPPPPPHTPPPHLAPAAAFASLSYLASSASA
jgi:hypothetical protein